MTKRFRKDQLVTYIGPEASMRNKTGTVAAPTAGRTTLVNWPDAPRAVYSRFLQPARAQA